MTPTASDRMTEALREFVEVPDQLNAEAKQLEAQAKAKRREAREAERILVLKGLIVKQPSENGDEPKPRRQQAHVSTDARAIRSMDRIRAILPEFDGEAFTASAASTKAGLSWQSGNRAVLALYELGELRKVGLRKPPGGHGRPVVHYKADA